MSQRIDLRNPVRRELGLEAPSRRGRGRRLLGLAAAGVLLAALAAGPVAAQGPYQQEVLPGFSSLLAGGLDSTPALADLDGDGDFDAVVGERSGRFWYFENTGDSGLPAFAGKSGGSALFAGMDVGDDSCLDFVDLDGDGDLDAVTGDRSGSLRYFKNQGHASSPAFVEEVGSGNPLGTIDVGYGSSPSLVDLDGDGDTDAVVGELYGGLRYYENTGGVGAPAFLERAGPENPFGGIDVGSENSPELVDLDADGDFDALIGDYLGRLRYFENNGSSTVPAFVEVTGSANSFDGITVANYSSPELIDLDGDGDFDAVVGDNLGSLRYFKNTGNSSGPAFVEGMGSGTPFGGIDVGFASSPSLADLDGDGDLDALSGENLGSLRFFKNTGSLGVPAFILETGSANPFDGVDVGYFSIPDLADLDDDGDLDAVVGDQSGSLRYFKNTGNSSSPGFAEITGSASPFDGVDVGYFSDPNLADLDGDGDLDAVVGERFAILYFKNTGSAGVPSFVELTGPGNPFFGVGFDTNNRPALADLDGDGDADAIVGENSGGLLYFSNTGSPSVPSFAERTGSANPLADFDTGYFSGPDLVDLDFDGDIDVLVGEMSGRILFLRSSHVLFADGFESGDTSAWSLTVP